MGLDTIKGRSLQVPTQSFGSSKQEVHNELPVSFEKVVEHAKVLESHRSL